jgi:hypothetical protein
MSITNQTSIGMILFVKDVVTPPQEIEIVISLFLTYRLPLIFRFSLSLYPRTKMDMKIVGGEESTLHISHLKMPIILRTLALNPQREI